MKRRHSTSWERKCDGARWHGKEEAVDRASEAVGRACVRDIECISRTLRQASMTTVDAFGIIRGEVAGAIVEARLWGAV